MENIDRKKTMKIAMVGVSPADQVTFKGYLRVLLRLDVDLDWVSVQVGDVDLYVVNEDFKNSTSIQKLQEVHPNTPTLYVRRNDVGDGSVMSDVLVLPLKQIGLLNNWLHDNVGILKDIPYQRVASTPTLDPAPQVATQPKAISSGSELSDVIEMIKTLHARPKTNFELLQNGEVIAVIDASRQLVWIKSTQSVNIGAWRLRMYSSAVDSQKQPTDMNQWLYQMAWADADKLLPLVDKDARYQLRSWAKPDDNADRRTLLRAMVALEDKACTVDELVARTGLSRLFIQKVVVSLLFAQHLGDENYQVITAVSTPVITSSVAMPSPEPVVAPTPRSAEQEEKLGFLARLRRKLGI